MQDRVNQQGTPTPAEKAWLAGIIEGEGSLMLSFWRRNDKTLPKVGVEVKVYNTDAAIICRVKDIVERLGVSVFYNEREQKPMAREGGGHYRSMDPMLTVGTKTLDGCFGLLAAIHPWLVGNKRLRSALMLEFLERRFAKFAEHDGYRRVGYDRGDLEVVADFYRRCCNPRKVDLRKVEGLLNEQELPPGKPRQEKMCSDLT